MTTGGMLTPGLRERLVELLGPDGALELMERVPQVPWHELAMKSDVTDAGAATKTELRTEIGGVRADVAELRTEIGGVRAEVAELRTEMRRDFATKDELRWAIETSEQRLRAEIVSSASNNLRWTVSTVMIGNATVIASVIAAFVALR